MTTLQSTFCRAFMVACTLVLIRELAEQAIHYGWL